MSETLHQDEERILLGLCRARDAGAWQTLFREYHPFVVQVIRQALQKLAVPSCDVEEMASTCLARFCIDLRNGRWAEAEQVGLRDCLRSSGRYEAWRWVTRRRQKQAG